MNLRCLIKGHERGVIFIGMIDFWNHIKYCECRRCRKLLIWRSKERKVVIHGLFVSKQAMATICGVKLDRNNFRSQSIREINCPTCSKRLMDFLVRKGMKW